MRSFQWFAKFTLNAVQDVRSLPHVHTDQFLESISCIAAVFLIGIALPASAEPSAESALAALGLPGMDNIPIPTTTVQAPDYSDLTAEERLTVEIFDRNTPSVVNIANLAAYTRKCAPISHSANGHSSGTP